MMISWFGAERCSRMEFGMLRQLEHLRRAMKLDTGSPPLPATIWRSIRSSRFFSAARATDGQVPSPAMVNGCRQDRGELWP
jgi:hypothetical protein